MRIALAAEGTRGDVYPMLALAEAFRTRGHEPVVCASPDFAAVAAERGIEFSPIGRCIQAFLDEQADAVAQGGLKLVRAMQSYSKEAVIHQFTQLPAATQGADLIIGAGVQAAAGSCAELHRSVYRYVAYCPVLIPSPEHAPMLFPARPLPRWLNRVMWSVARFAFNAALRGSVNRLRGDLGLKPVRDLYRHLLSDRTVVACDRELVDLPPEIAAATDSVPCLHPMRAEPLPSKLESFLDAGPPPVFLGFGSMTDPEPAATTRKMLDAIAQVGCRALISEGWARLGAGSLPEGVMTVGPCSHTALFPRVAAVVHHGGAGTTTTAARAGAPQILIPHLLDQYYWANRISMLGIGPPAISRATLSVRGLADTIAATLENELVAERASELGQRLRDSATADPTRPFLDAV